MATVQPALAATITWGAATDIVGGSDVFTGGKSVYGYAIGTDVSGPIIVNGVSFATIGFSTNPAVVADVNLDGVFGPTTAIVVGSYFPLSSPASYNGILRGAAFNNTGFTASMNVTLNNLTAGIHYAVQVWSGNVDYGGTDTTYVGAVGLKMLPGQYAIGTFVADCTSQVMSLTGTNFQINALQVRDVPIPATAALLGLGLVGIGAARRKQA